MRGRGPRCRFGPECRERRRYGRRACRLPQRSPAGRAQRGSMFRRGRSTPANAFRTHSPLSGSHRAQRVLRTRTPGRSRGRTSCERGPPSSKLRAAATRSSTARARCARGRPQRVSSPTPLPRQASRCEPSAHTTRCPPARRQQERGRGRTPEARQNAEEADIRA